jgi:hypothetical protein
VIENENKLGGESQTNGGRWKCKRAYNLVKEEKRERGINRSRSTADSDFAAERKVR